MTRQRPVRHPHPVLEPCNDTTCMFCQLGERLLDLLDVMHADTSTELLTLVRVLAGTAVANANRPGDLSIMVDLIVQQLYTDVAVLAGAKATADAAKVAKATTARLALRAAREVH